MNYVIGVSGASGALFTVDLLDRLKEHTTSLMVSKWGRYVLKEEVNLTESDLAKRVTHCYSDEDLAAPLSSGSNPFDAMVIVPCSTSTMAKIASGIGDTLITRTAQVALKERRRLILVLREAPLSTLHLEQAAKLSADGAVIMPLAPLFYQNPQSIEELVEHFNQKLLQLMGAGEAVPWEKNSA